MRHPSSHFSPAREAHRPPQKSELPAPLSKNKKWARWIMKFVLFAVFTEGLFAAYEMLDALMQLKHFGLL